VTPDKAAAKIQELEAALSAAEARAARAQEIIGRCDLLNEELCIQVKRLEAELQALGGELTRARRSSEGLEAENARLRALVRNLETARRQPDGLPVEPGTEANQSESGIDVESAWLPKRAS
jgi:chromosome segregation ATPase